MEGHASCKETSLLLARVPEIGEVRIAEIVNLLKDKQAQYPRSAPTVAFKPTGRWQKDTDPPTTSDNSWNDVLSGVPLATKIIRSYRQPSRYG
jgi:hypothetical protein